MSIPQTSKVKVERLEVRLNADPRRVLLRPYPTSGPAHANHLITRILEMSEPQVEQCWQANLLEFRERHRDYVGAVELRYESLVVPMLSPNPVLSDARRRLLGASFSMEYSLECAALFNPSIVAHPDQAGAPEGGLRFILSLRATGEGHISSITFRVGSIDRDGYVHMEPASPFVQGPLLEGDAESGYRASFPESVAVSEQALFPVTPPQSNGLEDARFVRFEDGTYYATYTAYDGRNIAPEMVATEDFQNYRFLPLSGAMVKNKGMALFPRKVGRRYTMLGRQDAENLYLMQSDDLLRWETSSPLAEPQFAWELVQIGNCGSPIETEKGWLVLTHGVGPTRKYSIGVLLLDLENPAKIIGRLEEPILSPDAEEREGYVPNVVYTCGGITHGDHLIVPYAISDSASRFARLSLSELLSAMA